MLQIAGVAGAHIVLTEPKAPAGSYYAGFFRVSHGCGASDTVSLRVSIPDNVASARPQPKPGWTLSIERAPLVAPVRGEGGVVIMDRVTAVLWRGRLSSDQFDQFGIMLKLPKTVGPLYFPVVQTCAQGENRWVNIPTLGEAWHDVAFPAPVLELTGPDEMPGMQH